MAFVTWEYYSSLHSLISEADFDAAEALAENEFKTVIGPLRWAEITESTFGFDQLKEGICQVMDMQANATATGLGKGVTSVSNDGYSESYALISETALKGEIRSAIIRALSGTGLVGAY